VLLDAYGGTEIEGGCGIDRVPAIAEVVGFFLLQLIQLGLGMCQPVLLQPKLHVATLSASIATNPWRLIEICMALSPLSK